MIYNYDPHKLRLSNNIFLYGNGSHAFYDALVWLQKNKPKSNPNIVLPIYIPAKLYRYVLAAGYEPVFYDVTPNCQFDPEVVAGLINKQTQAVFAIHYFGIPSPVKALKTLIEETGVFLFEDCVHTLNSRFDGEIIGTVGDAAIFSMRKMLQMPSGGMLLLNNPEYVANRFQPSWRTKVRNVYTAYHFMVMRLKYLYFNLTKGEDPLKLAWIPQSGYIDLSEDQYVTTKQMSRLSARYLSGANLDEIIEKRRNHYHYLLNSIRDIAYIRKVFPDHLHEEVTTENGSELHLKTGITPYSFPVLVPSRIREKLRKALCDLGIGCGAGWPEAPFHHNGYTITEKLANRLLELPIHQGMNVYQLQRMVSCLKTYEFEHHVRSIINNPNNEKPVVTNP